MRLHTLAIATSLALMPAFAGAGSTEYNAAGIPLHWQRATVPFAVDPDSTVEQPFTDLDDIVRRAAAAWATAPDAPRIVPISRALGSLGYDSRRPDNSSGVVVFRDRLPPGMNRNALAVTLVTVRHGTGEILDADVVVNAGRHRFAALGPEGLLPGPEVPYDIQNVLTHELGHVLGLSEDRDEPEATMYPTSAPGEVIKRDIAEVDRESVRLAYAGVAFESEHAGGCGGARVAPIRAGRTLVFGALAVLLLALAAARSRLRKGGLIAAAGALLVVAAPGPNVRETAARYAVVYTHAQRVGGLIVTRATLVNDHGERRSVELLGGRDGELEMRAFDAPSGVDLVPGARVDLDGEHVVRVVRAVP